MLWEEFEEARKDFALVASDWNEPIESLRLACAIISEGNYQSPFSPAAAAGLKKKARDFLQQLRDALLGIQVSQSVPHYRDEGNLAFVDIGYPIEFAKISENGPDFDSF